MRRVVTFAERSVAILRIVTAVAAFQAAAAFRPAGCRADTLVLHTGGLIRGRVSDASFLLGSKPVFPDKEAAAKTGRPNTITVTTLTGGRLVLDASQVRVVTRRPMLQEEFEVRKRHTPEEIDCALEARRMVSFPWTQAAARGDAPAHPRPRPRPFAGPSGARPGAVRRQVAHA